MRCLAFAVSTAGWPASSCWAETPRHGSGTPLCRRRALVRRLRMAHSPARDDGGAAHARDTAMMRRCVELAKRAEGQTRPNPIVGCVLVDANAPGTVIAEGFHPRAGQMHAEAVALADAERRGRPVAGATAYVSLEPCNHTGRTPPCAAALVRAKVARVVVGMVDPDPRVSGRGIRTLRDAGIDVVVGVEEALCRTANEAFVHRILHRRPFGILKYAMTLDGKIATETGSSQWVTGAASRSFVHSLRSAVDAIIIGGETLRKDDARLTVRVHGSGEAGNDPKILTPLRVVMTRSMDLPRHARMWEHCSIIRTIVLTSPGHGRPEMVDLLREKRVEVHEIPDLGPMAAMKFLYDQDALSVLWECGGRLAAAAIADGAVQKVHAFIAPKIVGGGPSTPCPVSSPALASVMSDAVALREITTRQFGKDLLVTGYL